MKKTKKRDVIPIGKHVKRQWVYSPPTPKFTPADKEAILTKVNLIINDLPKLFEKVTLIDMRSNRIYLYEKVEQILPEGAVLIKPLIEGKYIEYPYARITMQDTEGKSCTADWQRYNNQWMSLHTGTMTECLLSIENDNTWW